MSLMSYYGRYHEKFIGPRRRRVIKDAVGGILPGKDHYESWLDIGTADQKSIWLICRSLGINFAELQTLDISPVASPKFKHTVYDGKNIPFPDRSFDIVSLIDVLHHTNNITGLLTEVKRVTRKYILIKDHKYKNKIQRRLLEIQDWFGRFAWLDLDFPLAYNFLTSEQWQDAFIDSQLKIVRLENSIDYKHPFPFNILFSADLHFICLLQI